MADCPACTQCIKALTDEGISEADARAQCKSECECKPSGSGSASESLDPKKKMIKQLGF